MTELLLTLHLLIAAPPPPGFEPVAGKAEKAQEVDANKMVVGAYAAVLVLMFGFVVYVARRQSVIGKELAEISERVKKVEKK